MGGQDWRSLLFNGAGARARGCDRGGGPGVRMQERGGNGAAQRRGWTAGVKGWMMLCVAGQAHVRQGHQRWLQPAGRCEVGFCRVCRRTGD